LSDTDDDDNTNEEREREREREREKVKMRVKLLRLRNLSPNLSKTRNKQNKLLKKNSISNEEVIEEKKV
jgi:hypothetical protein